MWSDRLSAPDRALIDHVAGTLSQLGYQEVVITEHVKAWLRFTSYLEHMGPVSPLLTGAHAIAESIARRFPAGSASRGRFLCTSVCIFLDANAQGCLPRRIRQLTPARTAIFHAWVPGYVKFLLLHRGMSKRTLRKTRFVLGELTAFIEAQGLRAWHGLQPTHLHDFGLQAGGRNAITRLAHAGILRRFLRYVYVQGGLEWSVTFPQSWDDRTTQSSCWWLAMGCGPPTSVVSSSRTSTGASGSSRCRNPKPADR
jgi:hypothetical protein